MSGNQPSEVEDAVKHEAKNLSNNLDVTKYVVAKVMKTAAQNFPS